MILEVTDALELLKEYGIRTVRGRYVDSAEDAVAFAFGRPIVLRGLLTAAPQTGNAWTAAERLDDTQQIRRAYDRIAARIESFALGRVLAQEWTVEGPDLAIEALAEDPRGPMIHLRLGTHSASRRCPPSESEAEAMVDELRAGHALVNGTHVKRMLAHLVTSAARLFGNEKLTRLDLNPVRLHENEYVVLSATVEASRAPHLHRRLDPHAHDRWGEGYRPSGPQ
jgi:hypothetical protein